MRAIKVVSGAALVALGASVPLLVAASASGPAFDGQDYSAVSTAFVETQTIADRLPSFLLEGPQALSGIRPESTRELGATEGIKYWLAADTSKNVCLISLFPGSDEFASMTCSPQKVVLGQGLTLQSASGPDAAERATLLPQDYIATPGEDYEKLGDQVYLTDADESHPAFKAEAPDVSGPQGQDITIPATTELEIQG